MASVDWTSQQHPAPPASTTCFILSLTTLQSVVQHASGCLPACLNNDSLLDNCITAEISDNSTAGPSCLLLLGHCVASCNSAAGPDGDPMP